MAAPDTILRLVERFDANIAEYKNTSYLEAQLRVDFLNPMMQALGWDVTNAQGLAEHLRDVRSEDKVTVNEFEEYATKAPDYGFYTHGKRRFFLEAKKPSIFLFKDITPAFQLRRYAWSAKMPLSILTDFEEFTVYDCRVKPHKSDAAATARILYLTYTDYAEKWDSIAELFHKDAVLAGSLEKFAQTKVKKGSEPVDEAFLNDIERWRTSLAVNIARNNHALSERDINHAVQTTIDRIIFLRIAEDRAIEDYGQLLQAAAMNAVQESLVRLYHKADDTYNSGLFHLRHEKGRDDEDIDTITPRLKIDDEPLRSIINKLYFPESPYAFEMIPPEVLGQVYEQFLGKVIVLDARHTATVQEKPEVRKAGGVYYTPQYIVEYIVQNTVGKLLANCKNPKEADNISICDPACGSGSFLLGAYQFVLEWYTAWYTANNPEKHTKAVWNAAPKGEAAEWRLTIAEKKRILLNSFYGVDIDAQAVEVTKLSLMLKALEGESTQTLAAQRTLYKERLLPDLQDNIKCGNALIGTDFYSGKQFSAFDEEARLKINAFDWDVEFASVMNRGGFDAVVGNPPYGASFDNAQKMYIRSKFKSYRYKYDSYIYFIEQGITLIKTKGILSYITPELWLKIETCEPLRKIIFDAQGLQKISIWGEKVFREVMVNTITFVMQKKSLPLSIQIEEYGNQVNDIETAKWQSSPLLSIDYNLNETSNKTIEKIVAQSFKLASIGEAIQGITPYDKYRGQSEETIKARAFHSMKPINKTYGQWLNGKDIGRYQLSWSGEWLSYGDWLAAPREKQFFEGERLLFREIPGKDKRIQAMYVEQEIFYHGHSITPFKANPDAQVNLKYVLALVNSKLLSWYGKSTLANFGKDTFPKLNPQDIKNLPIRTINFADKTEKSQHDSLVQLVSEMLALHKEQAATESAEARKHLERQIAGTDKRIDALVYALYGLTVEEIAVVEGH